MGMMVNAITKSGTNTLVGHVRRLLPRRQLEREGLHPEDRVLPYQDQQVSGTFGGPIVRDRIHFFAQLGVRAQAADDHVRRARYLPTFNIDLTRHPVPRTGWREGRLAVQSAEPPDRAVEPVQQPTADHRRRRRRRIRRRRARTTGIVESVLRRSTRRCCQTTRSTRFKGGLNDELLHARADRHLGHDDAAVRTITAQILRRHHVRASDRRRHARVSISPATRSGRRPTTRSAPVSRTTSSATTSRPSFKLGGRHDLKFGGEFIRYTMPQSWSNIGDGPVHAQRGATGEHRAADSGLERRVDVEPRTRCRR